MVSKRYWSVAASTGETQFALVIGRETVAGSRIAWPSCRIRPGGVCRALTYI